MNTIKAGLPKPAKSHIALPLYLILDSTVLVLSMTKKSGLNIVNSVCRVYYIVSPPLLTG